jgi:predicted GNAT family acetyltransferase
VWRPCVEATALEIERLGVIARLFVSPAARGDGVAGALLTAALPEAERRGLRPVLDVTVDNREAIAFYERRGWTRVGEATLDLTDPPGATLEMALYVGPEPRPVVAGQPGTLGNPGGDTPPDLPRVASGRRSEAARRGGGARGQ